MYNFNSQMPYMPRQNNGITWVNGIEGAKAYQIMPSSNILLMDSENDGVFYIKVSDNVGMCTLRTFKYVETTNQPQADKYVTREEFENLIKQLGGLDEQPVQSTKFPNE